MCKYPSDAWPSGLFLSRPSSCCSALPSCAFRLGFGLQGDAKLMVFGQREAPLAEKNHTPCMTFRHSPLLFSGLLPQASVGQMLPVCPCRQQECIVLIQKCVLF